MRLLIVEDDAEAAAYLVKAFREAGHVADHAPDGLEGYAMAQGGGYDVLVVDRMLPRMDGLSVIRSLREQGETVPALILSALAQVDDRVKGLRAGGDDYLTKPFGYSELSARLENLMRRRPTADVETKLTCGDLVVDLLSRRVSRAGRALDLLPREFKLLEYLLRHKDRVVTRTMLLEQVWDYRFDPHTSVVDTHISRLRKKIDEGFGQPLLHTLRGTGYRLSTEP